MKIKSPVIFLLLFMLGFSLMHEYTSIFDAQEHCVTAELVHELEVSSSHSESCETHFEYHQPFVLATIAGLSDLEMNPFSLRPSKETYTFQTYLNFLKPPIA